MVESLKLELNSVVQEINEKVSKINSENTLNDLNVSIDERFENIKEQINKKREEFIELYLKSSKITPITRKLSKTEDGLNQENEKEIESIIIEDTTPKSTGDKIQDFRNKLKFLIEDINYVIGKTNNLEEGISTIRKKDPVAIFKIHANEIKIKDDILIKLKITGDNFPITFGGSNKYKSYEYLDDTKKRIRVMGTTCYTYYYLNQEFTNEAFVVYFSADVVQTNDYFYFGLINENVSLDSCCMCCNIKNACYFRLNGNVNSEGSSISKSSLKLMHGKSNLVRIRFDGIGKEVFFTVNDESEEGPFKISGTKFRVTTASCNQSSGTIQIISSYYIK